MEIWYRSGGGSGSVDLSLDIGAVDEDSDGDGILDTEDVNGNGYLDRDTSGSEDAGYAFNPSGGASTVAGSGPGLNTATEGDGTLTTEDLNGSGTLDTVERVMSFPGTKAFKNSDAAFSALAVDLSDTSWKMARIYLQRNALSESDLYALRRAGSMRLILNNSTAASALIYVDSIKLVASRWKDLRINGVINEDSTAFKVNLVDSINDAEYRVSSFMKEEKQEYEKLYGDRTSGEIQDEKESSLALTYALSGGTASATRYFSKSLDLRRYHTLSLWLNAREFTAGDTVSIYLCTTDSDYFRYDIPLTAVLSWKEYGLQLDDSSTGRYEVSATKGNPDRGMISRMLIGVSGGAGRLWVNTITATEPATLTGDAWWCEGEIGIERPLFITKGGTAVGKDITILTGQRSHSGNYMSPGRTDLGLDDHAHEFRASAEILPGWKNSAAAVLKKSSVDSFDPSYSETERGVTRRNTYSYNSEYRSGEEYRPVFLLNYNGETFENSRKEYLSETLSRTMTDKQIHSPRISYEQTIPLPMESRISVKAVLDNSFSKENISRRAEGAVVSAAEDDLAERDREAVQKNDLLFSMEYALKHFYFTPQCSLYSNEIVCKKGGDLSAGEILHEVNGAYHFPFLTGKDIRYVERITGTGFRWGIKDSSWCSFADEYSFQYGQNLFQDYTDEERILFPGYLRSHGTNASAGHSLSVPFTFDEPLFLFIRSAGLTYSRKLYFDEAGVPYEGEGRNYIGEDYGISRSASGMLPVLMNAWSFPPWHFFTGRGTFARARDYLNDQYNSSVQVRGIDVTAYENSMKLVENAGINSSFIFKGVTASAGTHWRLPLPLAPTAGNRSARWMRYCAAK
ncbi:MAG: hypothetical protein ACRCUT_08315, partial [Spirochaetota bacterium]